MPVCFEIIEYMKRIAPVELAEDYDNVGLLIGDSRQQINRILLCVDVTDEVINEAIGSGAEMILSHHPLIFKSLKRIVEEDFKGRLISKLIKNNICLYSAHTNLDKAENGVDRCLAERLQLNNIEYVDGYVGELESSMDIIQFTEHIKKSLNVSNLRVVGNVSRCFRRVAVACGSFDDDLDAVKSKGVDVIVTSDIKHHTAVDAREEGICIIDAGHYNTEKVILPILKNGLTDNFKHLDAICTSAGKDPFEIY